MAITFLKRKQKAPERPARAQIPVFPADPEQGLSSAQAQERLAGGWGNTQVDPPGKTARQIVAENVFTYFNLIFFILAGCVIAVNQWLNLTFMGTVICNTLIGIVQDLRAQKKLNALRILTAPRVEAVRDGQVQKLPAAELVRDDICVFSAGDQICADAVVADGECRVNESLVTGEADEIVKKAGDSLLSGSYVVGGACRARLTAVGEDSFVSRLTIEAKRAGGPPKSEMMRALTSLIKWIGLLVIPLGAVMFVKEAFWLHREIPRAVTSTVGALIGMIPEGLYLLTSLALMASVIRLANRRTLVHDMDCIETLARVDTLCVDKTGTITEPKMTVEDVVLLQEDRYVRDDIRMIMADYVYAMQGDNDTMAALKRYFTGKVYQQAEQALPFTSAKKYGGVSFHEDETYLLGAPDVLLDGHPERERLLAICDAYFAKGCRVLLLALYDGALDDEALTAPMMPLALILLANKIRREAPATFAYFAEQGVQVKVISGDNPVTVSEVARRAGIPGTERSVDARELTTDAALTQAALEQTVFGRVVPEQKKKLVQAMKAAGHTVAMTGDGVNDVLALREADCSVAMASGSDVACQASHIVLLNSNFSSMPSVVAEGRRVINNIERSASLYLVKNIFTFVLSILTLVFTLPYPYSPAQLTLVNGLTIGIPSFILAMEPNERRVSGRFLHNVIFRALPAAMTDLALVVGVMLFYLAFRLDESALSTLCTGVMGIVGLMMVYETAKPLNRLRAVMMVLLTAAFFVCYFAFPQLFTLTALDAGGVLILGVLGLLAFSAFRLFTRLTAKLEQALAQRARRAAR